MSLFRSLGLLTLAMLATLALTAWHAGSRHGEAGIVAAAIAAGVCWLGAALALILLDRSRRSGQVVSGVLLGMIVRLALPLGLGVFLDGQGGDVAEAGVFGLIVISYLVALVSETLLSLRVLQHPRSPAHSV